MMSATERVGGMLTSADEGGKGGQANTDIGWKMGEGGWANADITDFFYGQKYRFLLNSSEPFVTF